MLRPEKYAESEEEEILYSDEEPHQSDSESEEEAGEWDIDWDEMQCVDEYGEDRDKHIPKKTSEEVSSEEELEDLELNDAEEEGNDDTKQSKEREGRGTMEDEKKESEEEGGDPWSRWVGREDTEEKEKKKDSSRGEEEEWRRRERKEYRREHTKPTLAELVLKGKVPEEQATRDKKSRAVRRSPPRRMSPLRRSPSRRMSPLRRSPSRRKKESPPIREERRRERSPQRRRRSGSPRRRDSPSRRINGSPSSRKEREGRRPSPSLTRRERSPRRVSPSPSRRIDSSPRREKKDDRGRMGRSPERRGAGGAGHSLRVSSPSRGVRVRRERSPLPSRRGILPPFSSPNRTTLRRSPSPVGTSSLRKISSPNRVMVGERSEKGKEIVRSKSPIVTPRKDLPSLLDVKIGPCIPSRMEGRVKREEKEEERRKEKIVRDSRDEKKEENKEERKRHIPIVWNEKETDAKKIHRSIGHVDGIETMERMEREERKEESKIVEKMGTALIPLSMVERVGRCPIDAAASTRSIVAPPKCAVEIKKRNETLLHHPQPTELVRIITNDESSARKGAEMMKEEEEGREEEVEDDEDEGGWLSTTLQSGRGVWKESARVDRKGTDPSSAARRLFGRATASAVSSSSFKDSKPAIKEALLLRDTSGSPEEKGDGMRTKKIEKLKMEERIDMRPVTASGKARRRRKNKFGSTEKDAHSNRTRLLEVYY